MSLNGSLNLVQHFTMTSPQYAHLLLSSGEVATAGDGSWLYAFDDASEADMQIFDNAIEAGMEEVSLGLGLLYTVSRSLCLTYPSRRVRNTEKE